MSEYNKPVSLMDKELIHQLREYGYSLQQIADAMGLAKSTIVKILKQDIRALLDAANNYQEQHMDSGNYITKYFQGEDGLKVYQGILGYEGDDPTYNTVAEWEEVEFLEYLDKELMLDGKVSVITQEDLDEIKELVGDIQEPTME